MKPRFFVLPKLLESVSAVVDVEAVALMVNASSSPLEVVVTLPSTWASVSTSSKLIPTVRLAPL